MDLASLNHLIGETFLRAGEVLEDVPPPWKPYLTGALRQDPESAIGWVLLRCSGSRDLVRPGKGVEAPTKVSGVEPKVTAAARAAHLNGTATVVTVVTEEGKTCGTTIFQPLGVGLDEEAVQAVSEWQFQPGPKQGQAVRFFASIQVTFRFK
jgi:TonB family protein